jgi:hypothetical protein
MDFIKLQETVEKLEASVDGLRKEQAPACRAFAVGLRDILMTLLKDRKEHIRPGQIFKDAASKNLVPGDVAARADALLLRWAGNVTPQDPQTIKDDAARLVAVAEKTLPVLKSYKKDK